MSRRLLIAADWIFAFVNLGVHIVIELVTSRLVWAFLIALVLFVQVTR